MAYGATVGAIFKAVARSGAALKALRHPTQKNILTYFTGCIRTKEMLLVLGRWVFHSSRSRDP